MTGLCRLSDRGILRLAGPDTVDFLQALVSNDVSGIAPGSARYATLLTPQGKFLHDFFVVAAPEAEGALLIDCERSRIDDLKRRLTLYRLRSKVTIEDRSDDWIVLAAPDGGLVDDLGVIVADPRHPALGQRLYWPASEQLPVEPADAAPWDARRIALGVPDGSRDMIVDKTILLEARIDAFHGIDFRKGCYVGQEITARSRYRGTVRKKLFPCRVDGPLPASGTPVTVGHSEVGEVRSGMGDRAIVLLRLERPEGELVAGDARLLPEQLQE